MTTRRQEFQSHNSPWTEMYAMHCQHEHFEATTSMQQQEEEQMPTREALADVYNQSHTVDRYSKRF